MPCEHEAANVQAEGLLDSSRRLAAKGGPPSVRGPIERPDPEWVEYRNQNDGIPSMPHEQLRFRNPKGLKICYEPPPGSSHLTRSAVQ